MRRTILFMTIIAALLAAARVEAAPAGKVAAVRGSAVIARGEQEKPARVRDDLLERDTVLTGVRSRAKLLFTNDSVLTLGSKGRLVIRQYLAAEGKRTESLYELADGKLRSVVGSGSFKIQTPTAFAAARGTVFLLWYDAAGNTTGIAVLEGGVEVRNIKHGADRMVLLVAGQMSTITGSEGPSPPQPFSIELWRSGGDGTPLGLLLRELAELGEDGQDISITDVQETLDELQREGNGQPGGNGNDGPDGPITPPLIEPPIEQQPAPPVLAPITVRPVFR